ncbi:hypothetical protein KP509_04G009000 [Ceratopteris richardii]|uniref:GTD-binding domain-containing protein n=1 Tax=Ceratopteris richardii TaxID=49495 RepID=A0A8T2UWL8_CERRI|nr:hypothetical protein KP509_04G009000 [Ceratopteris richardii]KAH7438296.1 hypothetical protein KP509_04G009000 [Ceratopteris richardii]
MSTWCSTFGPLSSILYTLNLQTMVLPQWQLAPDNDPWNVSALVSAVIELFLSMILLLGAGISFFTSRIVSIFGLDPPCTYMGCSHPLRFVDRQISLSKSKERSVICGSRDGLNNHSGGEVNLGREGGVDLGCKGLDAQYSALVSPSSNPEIHLLSKTEARQDIFRSYRDANEERQCDQTDRKDKDRHRFVDTFPHPVKAFSGNTSCDEKCRREDSAFPCSEALKEPTNIKEEDAKEERQCDQTERKDEDAHRFVDTPDTLKTFSGNTSCDERCRREDSSFPQCSEALKETTNFKERNGQVQGACDGRTWVMQNPEDFKGHVLIEENEEKSNDVHDYDVNLLQSCGATKESLLQTDKEKDDLHFEDAMLVQQNDTLEGQITVKEVVEGTERKEQNATDQCKTLCFREVFKDYICVRGPDKNNTHASDFEMSLQHEETLDPSTSTETLYKSYHDSDDHDVNVSYKQHMSTTIAAAELHGVEKQEIDNAESTSMLSQQACSIADAANKQQLSMSLDENQCCIQFGSISACVKENFLAQLFREDKALLIGSFKCEETGEEAIVEEQEESLDALKRALEEEKALLETELEKERNAAAVATSEAMAMISRLQEEKSTMQMQVTQLQRISEERANYDEQVMMVLKEILFKRENESMALEKEVEFYREKLWRAAAVESNETSSESDEPHDKSLLVNSRQEEPRSPAGSFTSYPAPTPLESRCQRGNRLFPWMSQADRNTSLEEHSIALFHQKSSRKLGDSLNVRGPPQSSDNEGRFTHYSDKILYRLSCAAYQQVGDMGISLTTTGEDALSTREKYLQMQDEGFHELQVPEWKVGKQVEDYQCSAYDSLSKKTTNGSPDSYGARSKQFMKSRQAGEGDMGHGGCVPVHDVYEVHSESNQNMACKGEIDVNCIQRSENSHIAEIAPRVLRTKGTIPEEIPSTPLAMIQKTNWEIDKSTYPTDKVYECDDLKICSLDSMEERRMAFEIQQLSVRLKAFEEDRNLLKEMMESFKHRNAEFHLLQEISQHLQELRMWGSSRGLILEDISCSSASKNHSTKKRRHHGYSPKVVPSFLQRRKL